MLNKRFKIAKCKTSLKLATSRIKLMRNKKAVQIAQMKKELAQLLESGQDRTARIRVEHVIREEKMVAAYDLIDIYCELIVARLPIIESQKTCPIDLKEAVTSVIFAAPRCSDIPELLDAKKHFTAKYGKEFVSAAIELRPECGVSRMLVEKLSAVAPNVQTKVKVLSDVAKEHNVNWEATLFEEKESKPPDDLLNGPTYFEKASPISVDSPKIQTSNTQNEQFDYSQQNKRFTLDSQNIPTANTHDMRPSGPGSGIMNTSQSFHRNNSNSSSINENWNMEFKDATSAAQAAAESAERASIAARAAAQLSSQDKITRQYSTESYKSQQNPSQHSFKDSNNRKSNTQSQQTGPAEIDTSPKDSKKLNSLRSRNNSINENSVNRFERRETSSKKESRARFTGQQNAVDQDDETDSDDGPRFDTGLEYDESEAKSFFPSPDRDSSPKKINNTSRAGSLKSVDHSVKFDLSDGPDSETETETRKSTFSESKKSTLTSRIELNDLMETGSSSYNDDLDFGKDLKFGTLTGGLRNKGGLKYPPYTKVNVQVDPTPKQSSFDSRTNSFDDKKPRVSMSNESDSDDLNETLRVQKSFKTKSQFAPPRKFFNNDETETETETESEEEVTPSPVSKRTSTSKVQLGPGSGSSRRTKVPVEPRGKTVISNPSPPKTTKTVDLSFETKVEANGVKKPSHVHPKLPDYDSLAARIQALSKMNH